MHSYSFAARDASSGKRRLKLTVFIVHLAAEPEKTYFSEFEDEDGPLYDGNYRTLKCSQLRYGDCFWLEAWRDAEWGYRYDSREHVIDVLGRGEPVEGFICSDALGGNMAEEEDDDDDDESVELEPPRRGKGEGGVFGAYQ